MPSPIKKGWAGGPGRPKKIIEERNLQAFRSIYDSAKERAVVEAIIAKAARGDVAAAEWLDKRLYGAIAEKREVDQTIHRRVKVVLRKEGDDEVEELGD